MGTRPAAVPRIMRTFGLSSLLLLLILFAGSIPKVYAATVPSGFTHSTVTTQIASGTAMAFAPDGRLFVLQQGGSVRIIEDGMLLPDPFLTLSVSSSGERGLLGIAFDPNFETNGYLYLYYTTSTSPIHNRVSRFTANGNVVVPASEVPILDLENLSATNHNGGAIHFGADGKLYIAVGDNAVSSNAQTLNNRLGKMLRINSDGTIPTDNPFYNTATGANRAIWALGLRNPFTFGIQPGTGAIYVNDVGQSTYEEINPGMAGANYGWPTYEGPETDPDYVNPLYYYTNDANTCAIVGAAFYNPAVLKFPAEYTGDYFFGDFCGRWLRHYDSSTGMATDFLTGASENIVDVAIAEDGSLYYLTRTSVYRVHHGLFADVPVAGKEWMREWIETLYAANITEGCDTDPLEFCPEREVTRAEMAVFIIRALEYPSLPYTPSDQGGTFDDVPVAGKEWMEDWIEEFYDLGITTGCAANPLQYCPERPVTRAEMAVFILRALEGGSYQPPAASGYFDDVPVAGKAWMEAWIDEFYRRGITGGCAINPLRFCPEREVTRAEMAVFILRAFDHLPQP